jgi:Uma2 family endonuclease
MTIKTDATIDELYKVPEKAELVNGEIVRTSPTGGIPGYAGDEIFAALRHNAKRTKRGWAVGGLPGRGSFSPDAAYYLGQQPTMKFYEGAPVFAVEVCSEDDYGPAAEERMAQKRRDYFATGTLVVWGVDLLAEDVIKVYRASDPQHPTIYRRGEIAGAEPAVPGWRLPVDDLFPG